MSVIKRIQAWDSKRRTQANQEIMQNFSVEKAEEFVWWYDHGFLRRYWTNFDEIAPGVFRSNYPNGRRFDDMRSKGIKAIINLRGGLGSVPYQLEAHYCQAHNIAFHTVNLDARRAPIREELLKLLDLFDTLDQPFLMHCKSGADRAGLSSALYLLHRQGASIQEAQEMLSLRYLHVDDNKTGIMGHFLKQFAQTQQQAKDTGLKSLRAWIEEDYDREALQMDFDLSRKK